MSGPDLGNQGTVWFPLPSGQVLASQRFSSVYHANLWLRRDLATVPRFYKPKLVHMKLRVQDCSSCALDGLIEELFANALSIHVVQIEKTLADVYCDLIPLVPDLMLAYLYHNLFSSATPCRWKNSEGDQIPPFRNRSLPGATKCICMQ